MQVDKVVPARPIGKIFPQAGVQVDAQGLTALALNAADKEFPAAAAALWEPLGEQRVGLRKCRLLDRLERDGVGAHAV
jgi:hypothetical protein